MKKTVIFILLAVSAFKADAQAVSTINENFDTNCPAGANHPTGWWDFNPIPSTIPEGQWKCSTNGRDATGGIQCTNYWGGAFHLDTAFLRSPLLNFNSYHDEDSVYLRFDARTDKIKQGGKLGKLSLVATTDSITIPQSALEISANIMPLIGPDDSVNWVTHSINLTGFKPSVDFHLAFRYTGTDSTGSVWYIDNVYTTKSPLKVSTVPSGKFTVSAFGSSASGAMTITYQVMLQESFKLNIYDVMGREVLEQNFTPKDRSGVYVADGLRLVPGLYFVRMSNGNASRVARAYVD